MWKADKTRFYFHNNKKMDVFGHLKANPKVQLFFPFRDGREALRVESPVEELDRAWADQFYQIPEKAKYENRITGDLRHMGEIGTDTVIFRVAHGDAWFRPAQDRHVPDPKPKEQGIQWAKF